LTLSLYLATLVPARLIIDTEPIVLRLYTVTALRSSMLKMAAWQLSPALSWEHAKRAVSGVE
jgi:hypothetical protein